VRRKFSAKQAKRSIDPQLTASVFTPKLYRITLGTAAADFVWLSLIQSKGGSPMHTQLLRSDPPGSLNRNSHHAWALSNSEYPPKKSGEVIYLISTSPCVRGVVLSGRESVGLEVVGFGSAGDFIKADRNDESACIILDLSPQYHDDFALQCELAKQACPPVIFICGHSDIPAAVAAMKAGALELLTIPVNPAALLDAIKSALLQHKKLRRRRAEQLTLQESFSRLTPREREVLPLVVGGLLNKQAASVLGISEVTLQIHRSQVMRKMQAESLADLVRMSMKLRIPYWRGGSAGTSEKFS
jgi:FixJ family two-component response regulator